MKKMNDEKFEGFVHGSIVGLLAGISIGYVIYYLLNISV
jgi:uncharacterized membrane-anchored protein YhcB (DUF1043 family)